MYVSVLFSVTTQVFGTIAQKSSFLARLLEYYLGIISVEKSPCVQNTVQL